MTDRAPASQAPQSSASLLTVAQLRAVPAAFRPYLPLCAGHPGGQAGSGFLGQEYRMQQLGIRLAGIRVVTHAAGKFLAGEHRGAGPHAGAVGDGSLQFSG